MDRLQIRAFLVLAEELHFGRAARRLHMAQPPLSRVIQRMERQLGAQLFERTTRSVHLTAQGRALIDGAQKIMRAFDEAERTVLNVEHEQVGLLRVGFAGPSSSATIRRLSQSVRSQLPGIELELTSIKYGLEVAQLVEDGSLDIAIARIDSFPATLAALPLPREQLVVVAPSDHWLADRSEVALGELADEEWVMLSPLTGSTLRSWLFHEAWNSGFAPRTVQSASDTWTILTLVGAGVGITLTVDSVFASVRKSEFAVVPLRGASHFANAHLLWRASHHDPALRSVIDLARAIFDKAE